MVTCGHASMLADVDAGTRCIGKLQAPKSQAANKIGVTCWTEPLEVVTSADTFPCTLRLIRMWSFGEAQTMTHRTQADFLTSVLLSSACS